MESSSKNPERAYNTTREILGPNRSYRSKQDDSDYADIPEERSYQVSFTKDESSMRLTNAEGSQPSFKSHVDSVRGPYNFDSRSRSKKLNS